MKTPICRFAFFVGTWVILCFSAQLHAQLTTLVEFSGQTGPSRGTLPCGLVLAHDGNLYGTTVSGGSSNLGTIFRMTPDGQLTTLVDFTGNGGAHPGVGPAHGLIEGKDGNFYGTTNAVNSSYGTVFRMTPAGEVTVLARLNPGAHGPVGAVSGLLEGSDGNFYGTTFSGGSFGGGMIYRVTPAGELTVLFNFRTGKSADSFYSPFQGLIQASDGNFYGTTWKGGGGANGAGTVFRMTPDGQTTPIARLRSITPDTSDGGPRATVLQASDGNFYGVASRLGRKGSGIIFKVTPSGDLSTLVDFTGSGPTGTGSEPTQALVQGPDGALYGTTQVGGANDLGTIFRVTTQGALTTLVSFTDMAGSVRGKIPGTSLIPMADGSFIGATYWGGKGASGTIFRLKVTPEMLAKTSTVSASEAMPTAQTGDEHISTVLNTFSSPDGVYSIAMVDKPWLSTEKREDSRHYHVLVLSKGSVEITETPTWRDMTEAFWSSDGKYLAVNNVRSDMGGDQMWIFALPSGKVLKHADDATTKAWMKSGLAAIEEHFPETAAPHHDGKAFLVLKATGWDQDRVKFVVNREEAYDDFAGNFDFDGMADPLQLPAIANSTFSMHGSGKLTADNSRDMTLQENLLGWWASPKHSYVFKDDGMVYRQGASATTTPPNHWKIEGGLYYEDATAFDIVSLTGQTFVCRTRGANPVVLTMKRVSEAEAQSY